MSRGVRIPTLWKLISTVQRGARIVELLNLQVVSGICQGEIATVERGNACVVTQWHMVGLS